jgi:hypothetical protein
MADKLEENIETISENMRRQEEFWALLPMS